MSWPFHRHRWQPWTHNYHRSGRYQVCLHNSCYAMRFVKD